MKIKNQFTFLVIGIIAVPILTLSAQAIYLRLNMQETERIILRRDLTVVSSSTDDFKPGESLSGNELLSLIQTEDERFGYIIESGRNAIILVRIDKAQGVMNPNPMRVVAQTFLMVIAVLFAFVVTMSILIARSITKSVLVLETMTR
ncbi:MAG: hypothetical protein LBU99_00190, partial [Spirochaetaceae bacterium]|nr:hypothetical protein [Spirochaetaceae bacterium]